LPPFVGREYGQLRQRYIPIPCNHQNPSEDTLYNADKEKSAGEQKTKLSTLSSKTLEMGNFRPTGRPKTYKKRSLPDDKIKQLHRGGMGAKAIVTQLKTEPDIVVS